MKRYLLFVCTYYSHNGGINDIKGSFGSLSNAIGGLRKYIKDNLDYIKDMDEYASIYIVDKETMEKVFIYKQY